MENLFEFWPGVNEKRSFIAFPISSSGSHLSKIVEEGNIGWICANYLKLSQ